MVVHKDENMNCISCGNSSLVIYSHISYLQLPVLLCQDCNLFMTGNSSSELEITLKNYYKKNLTIDTVMKTIESDHNNNYGKYLTNLWKSHYTYCRPFLHSSKNLLEIGPGTGLALRMFEDSGFNVTGIESNENYVKFINQKLKKGRCVKGFFEDVELDQRFDVIWLSHCFEHVVRPDLLLKKCKNHLSDKGFIFIAVPDCDNINTLKSSIFENASSFHFTKNALRKIAKKTGFRIEKCDSVRELVKIEGRIETMLHKYLKILSRKTCPYYPFKVTNKKNGIEIRLILRH